MLLLHCSVLRVVIVLLNYSNFSVSGGKQLKKSWLFAVRHPPSQTDPRASGAGPLVNVSEVGSPMTGDFTVVDDVAAIAPIVVSVANKFAEYEASGSTAWEATIDVRQRPEW